MTEYKLVFDKETENKWRWVANIDGVAFKFYMPQQFVPQPPPSQIVVGIETDAARATVHPANIKAAVEYVEELTETVRYAPTGDPKNWPIGEPYVPMTELIQPWPKAWHPHPAVCGRVLCAKELLLHLLLCLLGESVAFVDLVNM